MGNLPRLGIHRNRNTTESLRHEEIILSVLCAFVPLWSTIGKSVAKFKSVVLARLWQLIPDMLQWWIIWLLRPKLFVGVSGVVLNEAGEVLLLRHRFHHRSPWGLPGGLLERGENLVECWQREVKEETNLTVAVDRLVAQRTTRLNIDFILQGRVTGGEMILDSTEILDAGYFPPDALPDGLHRNHRAAIRQAVAGQVLLTL